MSVTAIVFHGEIRFKMKSQCYMPEIGFHVGQVLGSYNRIPTIEKMGQSKDEKVCKATEKLECQLKLSKAIMASQQ